VVCAIPVVVSVLCIYICVTDVWDGVTIDCVITVCYVDGDAVGVAVVAIVVV